MNTKDFEITQDLIMGLPVPLVCTKYDVPVEEVIELMNSSPHFAVLTPALRKQIALARLDTLAAATMPNAANGDITAINTYLKIQEREAKLVGLDSQTDERTKITIELPWIQQGRLSYRESVAPIETEVTQVQDVVPKPTPFEPWKPSPEDNGLNAEIRQLGQRAKPLEP